MPGAASPRQGLQAPQSFQVSEQLRRRSPGNAVDLGKVRSTPMSFNFRGDSGRLTLLNLRICLETTPTALLLRRTTINHARRLLQNSGKNEYECLRDCLVRWHYGESATAGLPPERGTTIRDSDLFPVPPPINNALYAYGDCLIWRGPLNSGGYAGHRHRQVLEEVFGEKLRSGQQVNHLCQRPFCLQPGHLYAGDKQDNSDDRKAHDGSYLRFDMIDGNRVPAGAWEVSPWWKERQATWLRQSLPSAADCHHHAGPRSFGIRQLFCQVCLLFLEDEERKGPDAPLRPSILRESSDAHSLETPRALTYQLRLALARESLAAKVWGRSPPDKHWSAQEFLDSLESEDDSGAVWHLWLYLGGPEGGIPDPT